MGICELSDLGNLDIVNEGFWGREDLGDWGFRRLGN